MVGKVRAYIDEVFNCEDIALNFKVSKLTCTGPLLVRGRDPYVTYDPKEVISRNPGHTGTLSKCINYFSDIFGCMPLVNESARIELGLGIS